MTISISGVATGAPDHKLEIVQGGVVRQTVEMGGSFSTAVWAGAPIVLREAGTAETFQQRVAAEHAELTERIDKLTDFFSGETFKTLSEAERSRLRNQARFMEGYADVLEERMASFHA